MLALDFRSLVTATILNREMLWLLVYLYLLLQLRAHINPFNEK